jgi:hypothetical protein
MTLKSRRRSPACLSDYEIDAIVVGEAPPDVKARADGHTGECDPCAERLGELREFARAFAREQPLVFDVPPAPVRDFRKAVAPARRAAVLGGAFASLALAAGALLLVRATGTPSDPATHGDGVATIRMKGGATVGFFVAHDRQLRRGGPLETVTPGDTLQFVYTSTAPAYVIVLSRDGAGVVSVYYSSKAAAPATTVNGEEPLPTSVTLDATLGDETVWGLVCARSYDAEALRAQVAREREAFAPPDGCDVTRWQLRKVGRAP